MHGQQRDLDPVDTWILAIAVGLWVRLLPVFMTVVSDFWIRDADSHRPDLALQGPSQSVSFHQFLRKRWLACAVATPSYLCDKEKMHVMHACMMMHRNIRSWSCMMMRRNICIIDVHADAHAQHHHRTTSSQ
jgi:hypothetical protein